MSAAVQTKQSHGERERTEMTEEASRNEEQYGKELVRAAREQYALRLQRRGEELPAFTRAALGKQREEIRREAAEAAAAATEVSDQGGSSAEVMPRTADIPDGPISWDDEREESSSDFDPNEEVRGDEEMSEGSESSSADDGQDAASDAADADMLEAEPESVRRCQPEEVIEHQHRLMGQEITRGEEGGFLNRFPRRWYLWDRFHEALLTFGEETYQRFPTRSTSSVARRNKQIAKNTKVDTPAMPDKWKSYSKTLVCTHGYSYKPRGNGAHQHQLVRYVNCKAKINAKLTWNGEWYIFVQPKGFHNHQCTPALWRYYAENRQITDPSLLQDVSTMRHSGSHARGILAYFRNRTSTFGNYLLCYLACLTFPVETYVGFPAVTFVDKKTTLRDVHNMIQSLKRDAHNDQSDAERAEDILCEFSEMSRLLTNIFVFVQEAHKCHVKDLTLGDTVVDNDIFEGRKLLVWRGRHWLNTTCIIAGLMVLKDDYGVGVVNPTFAGFVALSKKKEMASSFGAFGPMNNTIIGCVNLTDNHWVAFHLNHDTQTVQMFDPFQGASSYENLKKTIEHVVEPILDMQGELSYVQLDWCLQEDGNSCGVWCIAILEMLLTEAEWNDSLYGLLPYIRMRYLHKCIQYVLRDPMEIDDE